jgi:hypothetical protein
MMLVMALGVRPSPSEAIETSTSRFQDTNRSSVRTQAHGDLKFEFTQYTVALPENSKLNQSQLMEADLRMEMKTRNTRSKLDLSAGKFLDLNNSFFSVQELYTSMQFQNDHLTVSAGRKIEFWSQLDQDWQLGLWEPKSNLVDSLRPVNQGLTGFFTKAEVGEWEILGFASPIFIPTMSPEITEKNGELVSDSRWYKTPASSGDVLNKDTRFVYSLSTPEVGKLIGNPGAALRVKYGGRSSGFWGSMNYARKPINSLFVKYDYNLILHTSGSQAEIEVSPAVGYHRLYGADVGWFFENGLISASFLRDEPELDLPKNDRGSDGEAATDWVQQSPGALKMYGAHTETNISTAWFTDPVGVSLDYLKAEQELTVDLDESGTQRGALLPYRLNFTNAASVRTTFSTVAFSKPLLTSFRYLRDFDQNGSLWTLIAQYLPRKDWALHAGVDILGVDNDSANNSDQRFLNLFRANDRFFGGLSYVF